MCILLVELIVSTLDCRAVGQSFCTPCPEGANAPPGSITCYTLPSCGLGERVYPYVEIIGESCVFSNVWTLVLKSRLCACVSLRVATVSIGSLRFDECIESIYLHTSNVHLIWISIHLMHRRRTDGDQWHLWTVRKGFLEDRQRQRSVLLALSYRQNHH